MLTVGDNQQRWSPRGRPWPRKTSPWLSLRSLKSLALALALASKPQVLENCPVLGSRTALVFVPLKSGILTPPRKTFPLTYTLQNVHLAQCTFPRKPIFQDGHLPECTFGRMDISPKVYFPE